jgi:sRNA-binding regulator protein Hfq
VSTRFSEDSWLDQLLDMPVAVYLGNGIKLSDIRLLGHDADVLFVGQEPGCQECMIYKSFISTVQPVRANRGHSHQRTDGIFSARLRSSP